MADYALKERAIPLEDTWDVVVAGGGPAGCAAAAAAARDDARTLLIEATGSLGGMGTSGLVPAWCPFSDKERMIYRGIAERVFREAREGIPHEPKDKLDWVAINPEHLKRVYDALLAEAGAMVRFGTSLAAVDMADEANVGAVVLCSKAGLTACRARVYVDCTGDADLAAWAGAGFHKGDPETGGLQPATHCFILANVDEEAYLKGPRLHAGNPDSPIYRILESGKYPEIPDTHLCNHLIGPGTVGFNAGHLWDVDNTDPASVSKALAEGRCLAAAMRDALAEFHPQAFGEAYLVATGALVGIRETRRIVGDYCLTIDDYLGRQSFPDEIARNAYWIDVHSADRKIRTREDLEAKIRTFEHYGPGESHGIPYRCLTPKGLANVLVAGRAVSCDRPVQGSVRVMPVCLAMGEAAGVAAGMAGRADPVDVHDVDTARLRARLRECGAYLP